MGIDSHAKDWIWDNFSHCLVDKCPTNVPLVSIDLMQHLKKPLPESVYTKRDLVRYFAGLALRYFKSRIGCKIIVVNVDRASPPVKQIIEHPTRHNTRCKLCKPLKKQKSFHAKCDRKCVDKEGLPYEEGPYLPENNEDRLPEYLREDRWIRFARDSRNLRRELYPLLTNEFLNSVPPETDQMIICNGFPARTVEIYEDQVYDETGYAPVPGDTRVRIMQWLPKEIPIELRDEFFTEVFMVRRMPPTPMRPTGWILKTGCPEMRNTIREADNSVFFFAQFFPECDQIIDIHDGDSIPIGLLRVAEDYRGDIKPTHTTYIRFKNLLTNEKKIRQRYGDRKPPQVEYLNVTQLYAEIFAFDRFQEAGVQHPVATIVSLMILNGTDFFKQNSFCPGIGFNSNKGGTAIWDTFWSGIHKYTHLVQWYTNDMKHDPTERRRIVVDENLFVMFVYQCYSRKYLKLDFAETDLQTLQVRCSKKKRVSEHLPSREQILVWCRNFTWNIDYWLNACRDIEVDPFETVKGESYYGFSKDKWSVTASVCATQKPVDKVFLRNFYAVEPPVKKLKR